MTPPDDELLADLWEACEEAISLVKSGLRKLAGPDRGTLTDEEAAVLATLILVSNARRPR